MARKYPAKLKSKMIPEPLQGDNTPVSVWSYARSGAVSGAISAFIFAIIHHLFISNIWTSLIVMMVAGSICGLCLGWSYALVVERPSPLSWSRYNALYVAMLGLLGVTSVLVFEPVTTVAALIQANEPPGELISQAFPMTALFTLTTAAFLSLLYRRGPLSYIAILLSSMVLVLFLGLNVSVIGLVDIPRKSLYLVMELFGLILALGSVHAALFVALERKSLLRRRGAQPLA